MTVYSYRWSNSVVVHTGECGRALDITRHEAPQTVGRLLAANNDYNLCAKTSMHTHTQCSVADSDSQIVTSMTQRNAPTGS